MSAKSGKSSKRTNSFPLTREALVKTKLKALRRGVWFRDLKQSERKLLDLTISVVERVRSFLLAKIVSRLMDKLCEAMESRVFRLMRTEGRRLVEKVASIGVARGNRAAKFWAKESGFIQYLTITNLQSFRT